MNQSVGMGFDSNSGLQRGKRQAAKKDFLNTSVFASSSISPSYHHRRKPSLEFVVSQSTTAAATTRAHQPPPTATSPSKNSRSNEDVTSSDGQQQQPPRPATHLDVIDGTPVKPRSSLAHLTASG